MDHRIERRDFPDVRYAQLQTPGQVINARRIEIPALSLHNEHERQNRRTNQRILSDVTVDFRFHFRRELGHRIRHGHRLIERFDLRKLLTHKFIRSPSYWASFPELPTPEEWSSLPQS